MKRNLLEKIAIPVFAAFLLITFFTACNKSVPTLRTPEAGMMIFNLVADQPSIGVKLGSTPIINASFPYGTYSPGYLSVYPGLKVLSSYVYTNGAVLAADPQQFNDSAYYSLFVMGAGDLYKNVFVTDPIDSLDATAGKAYIRYVNAVVGTDETSVKVNTGGTDVINDLTAMGKVSGFIGVAPGNITVDITNPGDIKGATKDFNVTQNGVYTILLMGMAGSPDTSKAMKISPVFYGNIVP